MSMGKRLEGKVAVVTGGANGLGNAIAKRFVKEGATVVLATRNKARLDAAVEDFRASGGTVEGIQTDVTNEGQVIAMVHRTVEKYGQIDVLVNNSVIGGPTCALVDLKLSDWNDVLNTDLTGAMLCAREALKAMIPRRSGNIINIGAEGGRAGDGRGGYPLRAAYCAAKMGLIGLTETLAQEVGEYNIRVNGVSPAAMKGERFLRVMTGRAEASVTSLEDTISREVQNYSLQRPAEEHEVAATCAFLASDDAGAITGQTIPVNCGWHIPIR